MRHLGDHAQLTICPVHVHGLCGLIILHPLHKADLRL
jgi:hypothetical protein